MTTPTEIGLTSSDMICRNQCEVCGSLTVEAIDLPQLPITDSFCREPKSNPLVGIDQCFLYCQSCGHGQLKNMLLPPILYGKDFCFRTSASATARKGADFFLSVLDEIASERHFRCVLDVGCNDLYLLGLLRDRAEHRVGIDPVWKDCEDAREDKSIYVWGGYVEEMDLGSLPARPDLILCRLTLEHVLEPKRVVKTLLDIGAPDALYLFEVPSLDGLLQRMRFDQVFHQHTHYFSLASFLKMLDVMDGSYVVHRYNYHDWCGLAVAFERREFRRGTSPPTGPTWALGEIQKRYRLFRRQLQISGEVLALYTNGPLYGYGAAQMLPVLGYHMGTDFRELDAVLDDDPAKDGLGYWNLPVKVMLTDHVKDLAEASVMITAVDNVQPIMNKLLERRPLHILYPVNII